MRVLARSRRNRNTGEPGRTNVKRREMLGGIRVLPETINVLTREKAATVGDGQPVLRSALARPEWGRWSLARDACVPRLVQPLRSGWTTPVARLSSICSTSFTFHRWWSGPTISYAWIGFCEGAYARGDDVQASLVIDSQHRSAEPVLAIWTGIDLHLLEAPVLSGAQC